MAFDDRNHMIFDTAELALIDFDQVLETGPDTLRRSVAGTRTFVKWDGEIPACVATLTTGRGPHTHAEMLEILAGPEWTLPMDME